MDESFEWMGRAVLSGIIRITASAMLLHKLLALAATNHT
jgi:hypothetical protein